MTNDGSTSKNNNASLWAGASLFFTFLGLLYLFGEEASMALFPFAIASFYFSIFIKELMRFIKELME